MDMSNIPSKVLAGESPLCVAAALLRRFSAVGMPLCNPKKSFRSEYRSSLGVGKSFDFKTRMGAMSSDRFKYEQDCILGTVEHLWGRHDPANDIEGGIERLSPELVLARLLARDGYRSERRPGSRLGQWEKYPITKQLVDAQHYLSEDYGSARYFKEVPDLGNADMTPEMVLHVCDRLPSGRADVPNPLMTLRKYDDVPSRYFASDGDRDSALEELEGLSNKLWHMQTSVGLTVLKARLMLQPDGGAAALKQLRNYVRLLDVAPERASHGADGGRASSASLDFDGELPWPGSEPRGNVVPARAE